MNWHPTDGQALLGLLCLIAGGILLIWYILRPGIEPPRQSAWNGRFTIKDAENKRPNLRKRDKRGRFAK